MSRLIFLLFLVIFFQGHAEEKLLTPYEKKFFNLFSENDVYAHLFVDRYYTAGTLLSFTSKEYDFSDKWLRYLSYKYDDEKLSRYDVALRQDLYTPISRSPIVDFSDHPYAGFLSLDFMLSNRRANSIENIKVQVGVVGPASLAQQTQDIIHKLTHNPFFYGWDTQIKNEFILNFHYEYIFKYDLLNTSYFDIDILPAFKVALGNANTFAGGGGRIRFGYNLHSDFGVDKINTSYMGSKPFNDKFSCYVFGGVLGTYVARDIFIQGNSFGTPRELVLEHFLYDAELGFAILYKGFRFSYVFTHQSKQFSAQQGSHDIGSILFNFAF